MRATLFCVFFLLCVSASIKAQQATLSAGGSMQNSTGSFSFSLGQVVYLGASAPLQEGVQQAYPGDSSSVEISEIPLGPRFLAVYPNPFSERLQVDIKESRLSPLDYRLYNLAGALIKHGKISRNHAELTLSQLPAGVYYLQLFHSSAWQQSVKLLKR